MIGFVVKVADALGCSLGELVGGQQEAPPDHDCTKALGLDFLDVELDDGHRGVLRIHQWLREWGYDKSVGLIIEQFIYAVAREGKHPKRAEARKLLRLIR